MRFLFLPFLFAGSVLAQDAVKTQTIQIFPDGRRVLIEDTTIPARTVRTLVPVDTVIPAKTARTVTEIPAPAVQYVPVAAVPVFAVPVAVVEKRYGLLGNLRETKVNGVPVERYGPLGFRRAP